MRPTDLVLVVELVRLLERLVELCSIMIKPKVIEVLVIVSRSAGPRRLMDLWDGDGCL